MAEKAHIYISTQDCSDLVRFWFSRDEDELIAMLGTVLANRIIHSYLDPNYQLRVAYVVAEEIVKRVTRDVESHIDEGKRLLGMEQNKKTERRGLKMEKNLEFTGKVVLTPYSVEFNGISADELFRMMLEFREGRGEAFVDMAITLTVRDKKLEINGHKLDVVEE